jgi:hypothetical protein
MIWMVGTTRERSLPFSFSSSLVLLKSGRGSNSGSGYSSCSRLVSEMVISGMVGGGRRGRGGEFSTDSEVVVVGDGSRRSCWVNNKSCCGLSSRRDPFGSGGPTTCTSESVTSKDKDGASAYFKSFRIQAKKIYPVLFLNSRGSLGI